jgi:hypothetical protein
MEVPQGTTLKQTKMTFFFFIKSENRDAKQVLSRDTSRREEDIKKGVRG